MAKAENFALIGAAGYIAPRHMEAIRDTGHKLVAVLDPNDSVGIIDSYFPDAFFFTEFERFDRFLDKRRRKNDPEKRVQYVTVCSPNYLHDSHIRLALRSEAHVICEKPLVLNPWNLDAIAEIERDTDRKVNTILQLRLHPSVVALREKIRKEAGDFKYDVNLTYITSRGRWYLQSWKGDVAKSGGIATNIGIHFFDMLHFLFGNITENHPHLVEPKRAGGYLEFNRARVRWYLSLDESDIPPEIANTGQRTFRSITINGEEFEFSGGFADLHTESYQAILAGNGFGLEDNRVAIETVADIRCGETMPHRGELHPLAATALKE